MAICDVMLSQRIFLTVYLESVFICINYTVYISNFIYMMYYNSIGKQKTHACRK